MQIEEVTDIGCGVFQRPVVERTLGPISPLDPAVFGDIDAQQVQQQRSQTHALLPQEPRRDVRVEQVGEGQAPIAVEPANIVVGAVEQLHDAGVRHHRPQRREIDKRQRVQQVRRLRRRHLHQAHPLWVVVHAVRLGVDGDAVAVLEGAAEVKELRVLRDERVRW